MGTTSQDDGCRHLTADMAAPRGEVCEECGSTINLRMCTTCGHVGCCESQQAHNTAHSRDSGHPVIRSMPLGPHSFTWCYECGSYV
ncbi:MAG: UBP-type zinc finger domain-containing protein [Actinomycetota bacterium]